FRAKLHKYIERRVAKAGGSKRREAQDAAPVAKGATNVVDFMALLKKSLAAKGGRAGKPAASAEPPARRKPATSRRRAS
ncbi:MAG TPA: hypothetical protein VII41_17320, partial [Steroidobacteraceae bacterium]